ncbi:MAG: alkyl hydroperoxide reductase [Gammaproteobacteria bacterium RIFCSPHIGHO2_12_FULL_41_20]|nr:MAG: alkyl hydroperoxide reductase [Gammaproteobacteria bacterium RIFCSPHIGHO2_12_FULL_41_20]
MSLDDIKARIPEELRDIRLNLSTVLTEEGAADLSLQQIYGIALASVYALKNTELTSEMLKMVAEYLQPNEIAAAKSAATIMAMNNVYYRFVHLVSDQSFAALPAKLRMNVLANPGVSKMDFELSCLAVSAINGCGMCMDAHMAELLKAGVSKLAIQSAIRIAAVMHASAVAIT